MLYCIYIVLHKMTLTGVKNRYYNLYIVDNPIKPRWSRFIFLPNEEKFNDPPQPKILKEFLRVSRLSEIKMRIKSNCKSRPIQAVLPVQLVSNTFEVFLSLVPQRRHKSNRTIAFIRCYSNCLRTIKHTYFRLSRSSSFVHKLHSKVKRFPACIRLATPISKWIFSTMYSR